MKVVFVCGLLAFAMGATLKDKLTLKAGDTMGDQTSTSLYKLLAGTQLASGQQLTSPDGKTTLAMQSAGNLVVSQSGTVLWSTGTSGKGAFAHMQNDGNFVVYQGTSALWASNTVGQTGAYLQIQNDTNLVIYSSGNQVVWSWKYGRPASTTSPGKLLPDMTLSSWTFLTSPDGKNILAMQSDGNLVVYQSGIALWNTGTSGHQGAYLSMQSDGNLVLYHCPISWAQTNALWSTNTYGVPGAYLQFQNDTNLVVYSVRNQVLWSWKTGTMVNANSISALQPGSQLTSGMLLISPNGQNSLTMQSDGNLVLSQLGTQVWSSGTAGNSGVYATFQNDGNFIVYGGTTVLWSSNTAGPGDKRLQLQDDTNLVIYSNKNRALWSSQLGLLAFPSSLSTLQSGATLKSGMSLISPDECTILVMQTNGNLVLSYSGTKFWQTKTAGYPGAYAVMETGGNFVIYHGAILLWASNTAGQSGAYLQLQDDINLIVYNTAGQALWSWEWGLLSNAASLLPEAQLASGQYLTSPDGQTTLVMGSDGNLVVYQNNNVLWYSDTSGNPGAYAIMQDDGNFVIYQGTTVLWATSTGGPGAYVTIQDDTNLVIYNIIHQALWSSQFGLEYSKTENMLLPGEQLTSGQQLLSQQHRATLEMQSDGDLVTSIDGSIVWDSGIVGWYGANATMQHDGNFVIQNEDGVLWSTNTGGNVGASLWLADNGNLIIYSLEHRTLWSSTLHPSWEDEQTKLVSYRLNPGETFSQLASPSDSIILKVQKDYNLGDCELYNEEAYPFWTTDMICSTQFYYLTASEIAAIMDAQQQAGFNSTFVVDIDNIRTNPSSTCNSTCTSVRYTMGYDGNFVGTCNNGDRVWTTSTAGHPGAVLEIQDDGNLVVYDVGGEALWSVFYGLCLSSQRGDGVCDPECNDIQNNYDDGDCHGCPTGYLNVANTCVKQAVTIILKPGFCNTTSVSSLQPGEKLPSGTCLISPDLHTSLLMQNDGNLVLYAFGIPLWSSQTAGNPGAFAVLQTNGFTVIGGTTVLWSINTASVVVGSLQLQDDFNLVVSSAGGHAAWSSKSGLLLANPASPNTLPSGAQLTPGKFLVSPDGQTSLIYQSDGNLVVYQNSNVVWASGTSGQSAGTATMQSNGNFVISCSGNVFWSSGTGGMTGAYLQLRNDTNLVVYTVGNQAVWSWQSGLLVNPGAKNLLGSGAKLVSGALLVSLDGFSSLTMLSNGNLNVTQNGTTIWSTGTSGHSGAYAIMQTNGNFTVYGGTAMLWGSNTAGVAGAVLQLNNDGSLVIYSVGNQAVWSSKSGLFVNPTSLSKLQSGAKLASGMCLISSDGHTSLAMQISGNLVVLNNGNQLWSSGTSGQTRAYAQMQANGDFTVFGGTTILWSSNTAGQTGAYLQVQNDTNVVIYSAAGLTSWSWKMGLVANPTAPYKLPSGGKMLSGAYLISPSGQVVVRMQTDGNLVLSQSGIAIWSSGTSGRSGAFATMQNDGNLVVYQGTNSLWASNTAGQTGGYLQVLNDTNLVIYSVGNQALWARKWGLLVNPASPSKLPSGGQMSSGTFLTSPDGQTILAMQTDGYLVLSQTGNVLWSSGFAVLNRNYALMQTDGNFVVFRNDHLQADAVWATDTAGLPGAYLQLQNDTNLVVYAIGGQAVWSLKAGLLMNPNSLSKLPSGATLASGTCLLSPNMQTFLVMQTDGNLVLSQNTNVLWTSGTSGQSGAYAQMQTNGNFTVNKGTIVVWSSNTAGQSGAYVRVQDDTNFLVYSTGNQALWSWVWGFLANPTSPSNLPSGGQMPSGTFLTSLDGQTVLAMQASGSLIVSHNGNTTYNSGTGGHPGAYAKMQSDGNFVVYQGTTTLWSSNTAGQAGAYLQVRNDTNIVVYSTGGQTLWTPKWGLLASTATPNQLQSGAKLVVGTFIVSPNGLTGLTMQSDGNLVLYKNGNALWSSGTAGHPGAYALMQTDGNFIVYQGTSALWASGTNGVAAAYLQLNDDTTLVVYSVAGPFVWSSTLGLLLNTVPRNALSAGMNLTAGMSLISQDGHSSLFVKGDGNIVVYQNRKVLWASNTYGYLGAYAIMQSDANFVIYKGSTALWSSGSNGVEGAYLKINNDASLVVNSKGDQAVWSSQLGLMLKWTYNMLGPGNTLYPGSCIISTDGLSSLYMQNDGNLVVYHGGAIWASGTSGHPGAYATMQVDGNLVVYSSENAALWASNTAKPGEVILASLSIPFYNTLNFGYTRSTNNGASVFIQNDGNLVVYNPSGKALWSSK